MFPTNSADCFLPGVFSRTCEKQQTTVVFTVTIKLLGMDVISILNSQSIVTLFCKVITHSSFVKKKRMSVFSQNYH